MGGSLARTRVSRAKLVKAPKDLEQKLLYLRARNREMGTRRARTRGEVWRQADALASTLADLLQIEPLIVPIGASLEEYAPQLTIRPGRRVKLYTGGTFR
jgi:hypothetical protein